MQETNNTSNVLSDAKTGGAKKIVVTIALISKLLSKNVDAAKINNIPFIDGEKGKIELAMALQSGEEAFQFGDDNNRLKSLEEQTIEFINNRFYIDGKTAKEFNAIVQKEEENNNEYYAEIEYPFLEGSKKIKVTFKTEYENNGSISIYYDKFQIFYNGKWIDCDINTILEIDPETHNSYDIRATGNGHRVNFSIVYNEYSTKERIESIIRDKKIIPLINFDEKIKGLENTQLARLNKPVLGKEVFKDGDSYYKTLFYSTNGKKIDITNIYFTKDGKFDEQTTNENKKELVVYGKVVEYEIREKNGNIEFIIPETSKKELIEKVRQDRDVLINIIQNTPIADPQAYSSWTRSVNENYFGPSSKIFGSNPIGGPDHSLGIGAYTIKLNDDKNFEQINCKVDGENIIIVDEIGRRLDNYYYNYNQKNGKNSQNYRISVGKNAGKNALIPTKTNDGKENPKEALPNYTGYGHAINLLRAGILTNFEGGYLNYFNNEGILIAKMPYDQKEDGSYEFNEEKYHTKVDALDLFRYPGFANKTQKIDELAQNLGLTNTEIRNIFEQSLINDGFDFNQNAIKITNSITGKSIYCTLNKNDKVEKAKKIYEIAEKNIDFMINRLELAQKINNSHILRKDKDIYKDFENFIGLDGFEIPSSKQFQAFTQGEIDEITRQINRGNGQTTEIIYKVTGNELSTTLNSPDGKGKIVLIGNTYTIRIARKSDINRSKEIRIKNEDIIADPDEED